MKLKTPYQLIGLVAFTMLLVMAFKVLDLKFSHSSRDLTTRAIESRFNRELHPRARVIELSGGHLVVSTELDTVQDRLAKRSLNAWGRQLPHIKVEKSWPEYFGIFLLLGSLVIAFAFVARTSPKRSARAFLHSREYLNWTALLGAYGTAAYLGWVWANPYPFWALFLVFVSASRCSARMSS